MTQVAYFFGSIDGDPPSHKLVEVNTLPNGDGLEITRVLASTLTQESLGAAARLLVDPTSALIEDADEDDDEPFSDPDLLN